MRKYIIIDSDNISSVDFSEVIETSPETLRYSVDGSKAILKYDGVQPPSLNGEAEYTHSEILTILNDEEGEWTGGSLWL